MQKPLRALLFASLTVIAATGPTGSRRIAYAALDGLNAVAPADGRLSVMTYNVQGLPWPVAWDRQEALARIGNRLAAQRQSGQQPHIVLLQEAFTPEAAAIARRAGYPYVATGPDTSAISTLPATAGDRAYLTSARWDRGEGLGKRVGSGLMILSDYPIVGQARMAFPAFACAGFDCLANKGVLVAHLAVPGFATPVSIVNTHLNARKAAGVPIARSQRAFARQVSLLADFVRAQVPQGHTLILGGDMNIGGDPARNAAFFGQWTRTGQTFVTPALGGLRRAIALPGQIDRADLNASSDRAKDWLFARDAGGRAMTVVQATVPFGREREGAPLSDHYGYALTYAPTGQPIETGVRLAALAGKARL
ncbi:endonuclease/exonuclease/phosphatase family protein [Sphingobium sp. BYY-5]|uniref:endonuclease/exonuclease/phosphatase family protein n=1 Tax=Sphingobium sp. BYY-5 TaxID=2926400 RepID=UPI001FA76B62|nr:endonuclease/exonuclease/phosphatase family protein [Sphingobium sp. BYY-5]MCI4591751.1 endonuclease/exonuclease/phosphatase family protein [Sphingobium sp. BYY-5]